MTVTMVLPHKEGFGPTHAGAVAMVVRRLALASDPCVRVIGPALSGPPFPGIDYHPIRSPAWLPGSPTHRYAAAAAWALRDLPPGLIEVHNKPDVALVLARLFPHRPVTLFLHNDPRTMRGANSPALRARLLRQLAGVATVSAFIADMLLQDVPHPAQTPHIIHNALDLAALPPPGAARDRTILFAGRVVPDKAPDAFAAACALALPHLPGWRAQIIGADGFRPDSPQTAFVQSVKAAAAQAGVDMLGFRPHPDVLAALSRAAIAVVPSRWQEPFGLAALEAMACGAALACSNRGGLAEITGGTGVLFDPDDVPGSAQTMVRLAQDDAWRDSVAAAGLARARGYFSIDGAAAKLAAFRAMAVCRRRGRET